jgi:hypothetical protein
MATNFTGDFNVDPYYDDFDGAKNYHRILFKPGYAVQARELTQSQTILQNQITNFADAIFTQNTPINGGKVTLNQNVYYLKLNTTYSGSIISAESFTKGTATITNADKSVVAKVVVAVESTTTSSGSVGDSPTLIVTYITGTKFASGDTINLEGSNISATLITESTNNLATGLSSVASIAKGMFYVKGNFVAVNEKTIVLDKYNSIPSLRIGLNITEAIIGSADDGTLLDPAVNASNYQAPGADRYQIYLTLQTRPLTLGEDNNFIELVRLENGEILKQVDNTVYSAIDDYFAKRTNDTNGDFIVKDYTLTPKSNTINSAQYNLSISKGISYIRGYRLENQSDVTLVNDRARTAAASNTSPTYIDYGNYFYVNSSNGVFDVTTFPQVDFHTVRTDGVLTTNTTTYNSTLAGTGYMRAMEFSSTSNTSNGAAYIYKAHVFGLQNQTLTANVAATSANSNYITLPHLPQFSTTANAYYNVTVSIDQGTSAGDFRNIVSYVPGSAAKIAFVDRPFTVPPDSTSVFTLRYDVTDYETIIKATSGTPWQITANASMDNSSKTSNNPLGDTVLQNSNNPELLFNLGNPYVSYANNTSYTSQQIFRNVSFGASGGNFSTTLTFGSAPGSVISFPFGNGFLTSDAITQNFQIIVTDPQSSGLVKGQNLTWTTGSRTVQITGSGSTAIFTVSGAEIPSAFTATIIAKVYIKNGNNTSYVLKAKNLVKANTTEAFITGTTVATYTKVDLTHGQVYIPYTGLVSPGQPQKLYITDVKKIVKIIDTKSTSVSPDASMLTGPTAAQYDVTSRFTLDNGQRDSYYDFASITLGVGQPPIQGNLLILVDYYSTTGGDGYYSVMSYLSPASSSPEDYAQIPYYRSSSGNFYELRDCLDFRPSLQNAQASFTINTSGSGSGAAGAYIPIDLTIFQSDYGYYLGRHDKLILTKDKSFQIVQGTPSTNPLLPIEPDGSLIIANLFHDPYTAYIPTEAYGAISNLSVEKVKHKRWLMSDISALEGRVNNIEYYTALNTLEKGASSLQISDANGLNRFKNGILVDDFSSYASSDVNNPDYLVTVNRRTKQMTASQTVKNFPLQSTKLVYNMGQLDDTTSSTLGYKISKSGSSNYFTLPYTTANVVSQPIASRTVNLNPFAVTLNSGVMSLSPPMDNWVDTNKSPDLLIVDPNLQVYRASDNVNVLQVGDWKTTVATSTDSSYSVVGHGINWSPFGRVGYTSHNITTYTQQEQTTILGNYDKLNSSYVETGGFITDVSVLPYIRQQFVFFNSYGMLVNSQVHAYFDGTNVDNYIRKPNVLELTGVSGDFKDGDIIGYYSGGNFTPAAKVISWYRDPVTTTKVRLYIVGIVSGSTFNTSATIQNAQFNEVGQYQSTTASGTINSYTHFAGNIRNASSTTITLSTLAANTDIYSGNTLYIINGTGINQSATISSYDGATKIATLSSTLTTTPAVGDIYSIGSLKTNEAGMISGVFAIPGGTFHTGQRLFRVDNRIANNFDTATTFAESTFYASGLQQTKQGVNYAASIDSAKNTFSSIDSKTNISSYSYYTPYDPVAQTFIVDKNNYPNGVFIDSIKLFFATKPSTGYAPVTISIVGTINGYPSGDTLDNSQVTLTSENIKTSDKPHYLDASTYTVFKFPTPVYLESNKLYALIVKCPTSNEYTIYTAQLGDNAVASSVKNNYYDTPPSTITKINSAPYVGSLFVSQNSQTWTADQNESMMFVIERCKFATGTTPVVQFIVPRNLPYRKIVEEDINYYLNPNTTSSSVVSAANTNVPFDALNITTTDFIPGSSIINYSYSATLNSSYTAATTQSVTPGKYGAPTYDDIYLNDGFGQRVLLASSNTSFTLYASMSTNDDSVSPILSDDGLSLYTVTWNINNLELSNSMITVANTGSGYNVNTTTVTVTAANGYGSGAVAAANISGGQIQNIYITNPGSGYATTPTITVSDPTTRLTGNANVIISIAGETSVSGGNGLARYFTKKVILDQGFDSGDLRVYFTAYRPVNTDIFIYYKILSRSDTQTFDSGNWQLMTKINNGSSLYSATRNDLYEFVAAPGSSGTAQNYVSYVSNVTGQTYTKFSQFAIKVVLVSSDHTSVPLLTDIRAIALPSAV